MTFEHVADCVSLPLPWQCTVKAGSVVMPTLLPDVVAEATTIE